MPELPDVETFKRYVDSTSLHHRIKKVDVDAPRMVRVAARSLRAALTGSEFSETARHGKYLLIRVKRGPWLFLHFGMTGRLEYAFGKLSCPLKSQGSGLGCAGIDPERTARRTDHGSTRA